MEGDKLRGYQNSFDAQISAQRLFIAALQGGAIKLPNDNAESAGKFLATAVATAAKILEAQGK